MFFNVTHVDRYSPQDAYIVMNGGPIEGEQVSHYRILEKLGEGGMGVVYKAEDLDLGRTVALKFLPSAAMPTETDRIRFANEARSAAALNHPNVCTIYEIGSEGEHAFISMEFIDGESLLEKLEHGPLEPSQALEIASQIADGLTAAHDAGIVHRDIKPANVMITGDGRIKILDFGLAKLRGTTQLTQTGQTTGTAAYMSPEQARGGDVDARADIWALGVVTYEMLTGKRPFRGDYAQAVIYSILNAEAEPIENLVDELPPNVARAVDSALQKDPEKRPRSAEEWKSRLGREADGTQGQASVGTIRSGRAMAVALMIIIAALAVLDVWSMDQGASEPDRGIQSVAVLPFRSASVDERMEAAPYATGLTEALIVELGRIEGLRSISRSSTARFENTSLSTPEIGSRLDVESVVDGSVLLMRDRLEVTVSLVDAERDESIWGSTFSSDLSGFLNLKSRIARAIADAASIQLSQEEEMRLEADKPVDPEAHVLYLQAVQAWSRQSVPGFEEAIRLFQEAIATDPDFALAYAGLANVYLTSAHVHKPPYEAFPAARDAALRALERDPSSSEALSALADVVFHYDRDWAESERLFREAIELNPGNPTAHWWYGGLLSALGRHEEALHQAQLAQTTDPLGFGMRAFAIRLLYYARRYDEAVEAIHRFEEDFPGGHPMWRDVSILAVDPDSAAVAKVERLAEGPEGNSPYLLSGLARVYDKVGRRNDARAALARLEQVAEMRFISPYHLALVHAAFGEADEAFGYLAKAETIRDAIFPWVNVDPGFDPIRDDPRFAAMVERVGL